MAAIWRKKETIYSRKKTKDIRRASLETRNRKRAWKNYPRKINEIDWVERRFQINSNVSFLGIQRNKQTNLTQNQQQRLINNKS